MNDIPIPDALRALTADDLDRVVAIDAQLAGRTRRQFYRKRLEAALARPQDFIYLGYDAGGRLDGFLMARLLEGEFGGTEPIAVIDTLGVDPECFGAGLGRALMQGLEALLRRKGITEIQTQADWRNFTLLRFLAYWGFEVAPRHVLERRFAAPR